MLNHAHGLICTVGVSIENVSMRMKILSLELLDGLLRSAGPVFKSSDRCIFAIKQYLCMSLVQVDSVVCG